MATMDEAQLPPGYNVPLYTSGEPIPACPENTYRVTLDDGSQMDLPIKSAPNGRTAIALLMSNQLPFSVEEALAQRLYEKILPLAPDVIVGVPTLGLHYARLIAEALGHDSYVALGQSRKFWYSDEYSEPASSITALGTNRRLYMDPSLVERVKGKRVLLVDDVVTTAGTAQAALRLLTRVGADPLGLAVVLTEGDQWVNTLNAFSPDWAEKVTHLGHIPLFQRDASGWQPRPDQFLE